MKHTLTILALVAAIGAQGQVKQQSKYAVPASTLFIADPIPQIKAWLIIMPMGGKGLSRVDPDSIRLVFNRKNSYWLNDSTLIVKKPR